MLSSLALSKHGRELDQIGVLKSDRILTRTNVGHNPVAGSDADVKVELLGDSEFMPWFVVSIGNVPDFQLLFHLAIHVEVPVAVMSPISEVVVN